MDDKEKQEVERAYYTAAFESMKGRITLLSAGLFSFGTFFEKAVKVDQLGWWSIAPVLLLFTSAICLFVTLIILVRNYDLSAETHRLVLLADGDYSDQKVQESYRKGKLSHAIAFWLQTVGLATGVLMVALTWTNGIRAEQFKKDSNMPIQTCFVCSQEGDGGRKYIPPARLTPIQTPAPVAQPSTSPQQPASAATPQQGTKASPTK